MKSTRYARVLVGLLAVLGLLTTACANDDTAVPAATTGPTIVPETPQPTDSHSDEMAMEETDHGHATLMEMDDSADTTIEVEVAGGKPVDGVQRHQIDARDIVTIVVNGDTTDELHIHGYDLVVPFTPGQPGSITFEADIPGIFEVETHHHGDLVMELQVG
ncbi:MAG: hypothetical protein OXT07_13565 [bacterium]|nr:hypothetical protein [bacterium]